MSAPAGIVLNLCRRPPLTPHTDGSACGTSIKRSGRETTDRRLVLSLSAITTLGLALLPGGALAQQKSLKAQITGTWAVVANDNVAPDGTKRQLFGPKPKGLLVLDANGQY